MNTLTAMPPITALVADDEPLLRERLVAQLSRLWPELQKHFPVDPALLYGEGEAKQAKETEIKKRLLYVQAVDSARKRLESARKR